MRLSILAAAATIACVVPGAALAQCKPVPPQVNVRMPPFETVIEEVRDVAAYTPFPFRTEQSIEKGWRLNGIALVKTGGRSNMQGLVGAGCYQPVTIDVEIAIVSPARIYIDSRFEKGSCNYEVVKVHELQHVDVAVRVRAAYANFFKAVVQNAVNAVLPQATTQRNGEEIVSSALSEALDVGLARMNGESARINAAIDSRENYLRTQALCPSW